MKRCTKCRRALPLSAFHGDASRPDGLNPRCRDCANAARRKRNHMAYWTPERIAARQARTAATIAAVQAGAL